MEDTSKKANCFVRTLIVAFCVLLVSMIVYNYFYIDPKGDISSGLITLLFILLVLILSESFDQFAIGKLFSMNREAKKKAAHVQNLEKEKADLLSQLITISTSNNQTQQHINVSGDMVTPQSTVAETKTNNSYAMGFTPSNPSVVKKRGKK